MTELVDERWTRDSSPSCACAFVRVGEGEEGRVGVRDLSKNHTNKWLLPAMSVPRKRNTKDYASTHIIRVTPHTSSVDRAPVRVFFFLEA